MTEKLELTYKSVGDLYEDNKKREGEYAIAIMTSTVTVVLVENGFP